MVLKIDAMHYFCARNEYNSQQHFIIATFPHGNPSIIATLQRTTLQR